MKTKLAESYEIVNIMNFIKKLNIFEFPSEELFQEYKTTFMEHIMRREAKLALFDNKIVGFSIESGNADDNFYAIDTTLGIQDYCGALCALRQTV